MGPWAIQTLSPWVSQGCADELEPVCGHKVPLRTPCARAHRQGAIQQLSKSYPDRRQGGVVLAPLAATELFAE